MIVPIDKALNIIAEKTVDNHRMLKQARRQRRTEYTDIYGVPFESETGEARRSSFHISISPDLEYWERFQFKLFISGAPKDGFDPDGFSFKIGYLAENPDPDKDDPVTNYTQDLAPFITAQHDSWVDGNGYFPTEDISDTEYDDFYDILEVTTDLYATGAEEDIADADRILNAGNKTIEMIAPANCEITFIPYIKYSTVNR